MPVRNEHQFALKPIVSVSKEYSGGMIVCGVSDIRSFVAVFCDLK
jgi:hypothetical protein